MKRFFATALAALTSFAALAATTIPVQMLTPTGSAAGQAIISTGPSSAPVWGAVPLTGITGTLAIANGGTGATSASAALTSLGAAPLAGATFTSTTGVGMPSGNSILFSSSAAGTQRAFNLQTAGVNRWSIRANTVAEGGSNVGSDLEIAAYSDAGTSLSIPISVKRSTGVVTTAQRPVFGTATPVDSANVLTAVPGRLLNVQVFSSSGTYTPTSGTTSIIVEVQGAGGGGGGSATTSSGQASLGSAGSAGTYAKVRYTSITSQTVTVATGGGAGTGGASPTAGGTASATSFGSLVSCPGGIGGAAGGTFTPPGVTGVAASPAAATISGGTTIVTYQGGRGIPPLALSATLVLNSLGGPSLFGTSGNSPSGYGYGGPASAIAQSLTGTNGTAGGPGLVIVYEYN